MSNMHFSIFSKQGEPPWSIKQRIAKLHFLRPLPINWSQLFGRRRQEHFLQTAIFNETNFYQQIQMWLTLTETYALNRTMCLPSDDNAYSCRCSQHCFPQAHFLFAYRNSDVYSTGYFGSKQSSYRGQVYPNLRLVGDMQELADLFKAANFSFDRNLLTGRNGTAYHTAELYPRRKDLLSVSTWTRLCRFLAIDYYLFDFELPQACVESDLFAPEAAVG